MNLNMPTSTLVVGEEVKEEAFAIGNMAVILELLRSKMYSNAIKAIVQEIASNARDANREVGRHNIPIYIQLPTAAQPELQIRDSGPGITPDRMSGVYLQYGNSTKRESNDQTGCFGLGAKTPFAYTSTFGIETVTADGENGKHILRHYVAAIDPSRIGKVFKVFQQDTDLPTGTTIKVPVKPKDIQEFSRWTNLVMHRWNPLPDVNLDKGVVFTKLKEPDLKGDDWEMFLTDNYSNKGITYYEDSIPYPVDSRSFEEIPEKLEPLFNQVQLHIFGKGMIQVTGNRESIDYQPHVQKYILDKLQAIYNDINARLTAKVAGCENLWDAMVITHTYKDEYHVDLLRDVTWKGKKVPYFDSIRFKTAKVFNIESDYANVYGVSTKLKDYGFTPRKSVAVLENKGSGRPNAAYLQQAYKHFTAEFEAKGITNWSMYVLSWNRSNEEAVTKEQDELCYKDWNVKLLSDFKPPKAANAGRRQYRIVKLRKFVPNQDCYVDTWQAIEDDVDLDYDGGIYVTLADRQGVEAQDFMISNFVEHTGETVYGIPQRFTKNGLGEHWIPFKKAADEAFEAELKVHGNVIGDSEDNAFSPDTMLNYEMKDFLKAAVKNNEVNGKIGKWFKATVDAKKDQKIKALAFAANGVEELTKKSVMKDLAKDVANTFPLVFVWDGVRYNSTQQIKGGHKTVYRHVLQYIRGIEAAENNQKTADEMILNAWTEAVKEDANRFQEAAKALTPKTRKVVRYGLMR